MPVTKIRSTWSSGDLIFHESNFPSVTNNVFKIGASAVKVGDTSQDVDFQFYGTGSLSAIIDTGAATLTLVGITATTNKPLTISDTTESTSATTGALKVSGGIGAAKDIHTAGDINFMTSVDSAAVIDTVSLGGYEISAGHRALAISSEEVIITEAIGASDRTLPVRINGATLKIMLHT